MEKCPTSPLPTTLYQGFNPSRKKQPLQESASCRTPPNLVSALQHPRFGSVEIVEQELICSSLPYYPADCSIAGTPARRRSADAALAQYGSSRDTSKAYSNRAQRSQSLQLPNTSDCSLGHDGMMTHNGNQPTISKELDAAIIQVDNSRTSFGSDEASYSLVCQKSVCSQTSILPLGNKASPQCGEGRHCLAACFYLVRGRARGNQITPVHCLKSFTMGGLFFCLYPPEEISC